MGRSPIKKSGPMTVAERQRKRRRRLARERKLANPKLVAKQLRRAERERELAAKITALPDKRYGVILADPNWRFEVWSRETGLGRDATNHYATSELDAIKARDVPSIAADDAVLGLWSTAPTPKSPELYEGNSGTGYWLRNQHEVLLIGTRGAIPCPAPGTQWPSVIVAPCGAHSEKPTFAHEFFETFFPNLPKIELYARKRRPGWDAGGTLEHEPPAPGAPGVSPMVPDGRGGWR